MAIAFKDSVGKAKRASGDVQGLTSYIDETPNLIRSDAINVVDLFPRKLDLVVHNGLVSNVHNSHNKIRVRRERLFQIMR